MRSAIQADIDDARRRPWGLSIWLMFMSAPKTDRQTVIQDRASSHTMQSRAAGWDNFVFKLRLIWTWRCFKFFANAFNLIPINSSCSLFFVSIYRGTYPNPAFRAHDWYEYSWRLNSIGANNLRRLTGPGTSTQEPHSIEAARCQCSLNSLG